MEAILEDIHKISTCTYRTRAASLKCMCWYVKEYNLVLVIWVPNRHKPELIRKHFTYVRIYLLNHTSPYSERNLRPHTHTHTQCYKINETQKGIKKARKVKWVVLKNLSLVLGKCQESITRCLQGWRTRLPPERQRPKWEFHQETELWVRGEAKHPLWPQFLDKAATRRFLHVYHGPAFLGMLLGCYQRSPRKIWEQYTCSDQAMTGSGCLYLWRGGGM